MFSYKSAVHQQFWFKACYWEGCYFENQNISQNKLHAVTGTIKLILALELQDTPSPSPVI
jgi:hypothetical protein